MEAIGCYGKEADTRVARRSTVGTSRFTPACRGSPCADRKVYPPPLHPPAPPPHPHQNWLWGSTSDSWAKDSVLPPPRSMFASAISSSQAPDCRTLHTQAHRPEHTSGCVHPGTRAGTHKSPVHTTQVHVDTTCTHGHTGQPPGTRSRRLAQQPALTHRLPPSVLGDSLPRLLLGPDWQLLPPPAGSGASRAPQF